MRFSFLVLGVLVMVLVVPVSAVVVNPSSPGTLPEYIITTFQDWLKGEQGMVGSQGLNNMTMNQTINLTANLTAGPAGSCSDALYSWINGTRAYTGNVSLGNYNISNVLDPVAAQDAVTLNKLGTYVGNNTINTTYVAHTNTSFSNLTPNTLWDAWTPTLTWFTATPTVLNSNHRWIRSGKQVFIQCKIDLSDSKGTTGLTISIPVSVGTSILQTRLNGLEGSGVSGLTFTDPMGQVDTTSTVILFNKWVTMTNGQPGYLRVSGFYEVD